MLTSKHGTNYFYQWDTNQFVVLSENRVGCTHVHFKNPNSNTAYKVKVIGNEARVPDELFQNPEPFTAWIYDEAETRTVESRDFYVYEKQKPANYEFTPTDAEVYQTLNERMDTMEKLLDTSRTTTPIPAKPERSNYVLLAVKRDGAEPVGTNFDLNEFLETEVTQAELDAVISDLDSFKAAQAESDRLQNADIANRVDESTYSADKLAQSGKDAAQDALINEKLDSGTYATDKQAQLDKDTAQDNLIKDKVDTTTYSADKAALEGEIAKKANSTDLALKADKADTYTKNEVDTLIREGILSGEIYGVDFNMVTGQAKRLDSAVGLEFHRFVGGAGSTPIPSAKSFMNVGPWANIYQTLRTVEGNNLVARTGDANFETALRSGECNLFTCIPKYFIKMETPVVNGQAHWVLHVSAKPFAGAFSVIDGDSVEIASIVTGEKNGKHVSQPGIAPLVNTNAYTFENKAELQNLYNSSWNDFLAWWILMLVQTANLNSQRSVGAGVSSGMPFSWGDAAWSKIMEASTGATNSIVVRKQNFKNDLLIYIGTNYYNGSLGKRHVTDVQPHGSNADWLIVSFDGEPITTTTDHWCTALAQDVSADAILAMGLDCGYYKSNATLSEGQCHAFVYGICDPWANIFQATSGIVKYNDKVYLASGRQKQPAAENLPSATWHEADVFAWIGEGWAKEWRIQQSTNSITMVPTKMGGSEGVLFGDYTWGAADGIRLPWRSGYFPNGGSGGAVYFYWHTASIANFHFGGRLTYQKKK